MKCKKSINKLNNVIDSLKKLRCKSDWKDMEEVNLFIESIIEEVSHVHKCLSADSKVLGGLSEKDIDNLDEQYADESSCYLRKFC